MIRLNAGETKNDESRIIPMSQELFEELQGQRRLRDQRFPFCQNVFFNHSTGKPIKNFRGAWKTACEKMGHSESVFHDFRRTGVRNLVRAGVPERVAMAISGHQTRSIFDRYNITNEDDVKAAAQAVEAYLNESTGIVQAKLAEFDDERQKRHTAI